MDGYDFLRKYIELQRGIMFDKVIRMGFADIVYCEIDSTNFWNFALVNRDVSKELPEIEERMKGLKRNPAIYFENRKGLESLIGILEGSGYEKSYEDSWLFWKGGKIDSRHFTSIKKVENEDDLKLFLKTYDSCFRKDDPKNPYGELGDYLKVIEKTWRKYHDTGRVEFFMVLKGDRAVAVSVLRNKSGMGYVTDVGSLMDVRGKGYGKAATLFCVKRSLENGNDTHFIATEEGTYPNEFYKKIGFEPKIRGLCYTKVR